ncbi:MAG TPA: class I SAM-dependent methyltransferase [Polyangiaceae bacterium]
MNTTNLTEDKTLYDRLGYVSSCSAATTPDERFKSPLPYLQAFVRRHFPTDRDAVIFEIGCGAGPIIHVARSLGYRNIRGVDIASGQVTAARKLGIDGLSEMDAVGALVALDADSLDCVVAFDLLEHLGMEELLQVTEQTARVLRPGGRWLIHVPNGESPFFGRVLFGDLTHQRAFTRQSLEQLLGSHFTAIEFIEDQPAVHGIKSAVRHAAWKVLRCAAAFWIAVESGITRDVILSQNLVAVARK